MGACMGRVSSYKFVGLGVSFVGLEVFHGLEVYFGKRTLWRTGRYGEITAIRGKGE